jgi:DNA modification methylase
MNVSTILIGDCLEVLRGLPDGMAQTCVTSPPYYGLRDYGCDGQIGLEATPDAYVARLVDVFREVRRVLRDDGTLWLNIGDSYARAGGTDRQISSTGKVGNTLKTLEMLPCRKQAPPDGLKDKDLLGIPWMVAFALRADGWWLRQDIIWHKPNPMPESVTDRCTKAHEYVFLLTKSARYFYDADSIREAPTGRTDALSVINTGANNEREKRTLNNDGTIGANARSVWPIATQPYSGAHFATMPPALAERCIKAGSKPGDIVLDPFGGAGTTGLVADRLGRSATLIELNPEYARLARERITADAPLLVAQ